MGMSQKFVVKPGSSVKLAEHDPDYCGAFKGKRDAQRQIARSLKRLQELQYLLYAEDRRAVLVVLQGMDAAGKDGTIRHVMGPLNPQGCRVTSFKEPTREELSHDFLWRIHKAAPRSGEIGIFNRSHYEDVLIARVHDLVPEPVWSRRYRQINAFEEGLAANNVHTLKFYLHISKDEQLDRFKDRLKDPTRLWKANPEDFKERQHWDDYMQAYQDALTRCSTSHAPWYVIPSNHKWFRNLAVCEIIVETMDKLDMQYPKALFDVSKIKLK